jgi:hypothetical protein
MVSGRRWYDWAYWPVLVAALVLVISVLGAKLAFSLEVYWTLPAGSCVGTECRVPLEGDVLTMDSMRNSLVLYEDAEKTIIVTCVERRSLLAFLEETGGRPLDPNTAAEMGIGAYYLGKSFADVLAKYPELDGTYSVINEDGSEATFPIITERHFLGCE